MKTQLLKTQIKTVVICMAAGSILVACGGGDSLSSSQAQLLVDASSVKINIPAANVTASSTDTTNVPANVVDGNLATHWTGGAAGGNQWIKFKLPACYTADYAKVSWYNGDQRQYTYSIDASKDNGVTWTTVKTVTSDGTNAALVQVDFPQTAANMMRISSSGSNVSAKVSLSDIEFWGLTGATCASATTTTTKTSTTTTAATTTTTTKATTTTTTKISTTTTAAPTTSTTTSSTLNTSRAPCQNFNLSGWNLQTLDSSLSFVTVDPCPSYTSQFFYTDSRTGAMTFYVPSGAGHTGHSHYPRVEFESKNKWQFPIGGAARTLSASLQVLQQPNAGTTSSLGEIIIGQIHGDKVGGSEALKLRWTNGNILMGVKQKFADPEQKIALISGVQLGDTIHYKVSVIGYTVTVSVSSGSKSATHSFTYDSTGSWSGINMYYKAGVYSQDDVNDGSHAKAAFYAISKAD